MKLAVFLCVIFLVGCAHQPEEQPRELKDSKYFQKNEKEFKVKKYPKLPVKAIKLKQSGWCLLKFDVLESGKTDNIQILDCSVDGYFEEFCLNSFKGIIYDTQGETASNYVVSCSYTIK